MNRDGESENTYQVQRTEVFARLVGEQRVRLLDAEALLRAWETKAEEIGRPRTSQDFWEEGWRWVIGELALERRDSN